MLDFAFGRIQVPSKMEALPDGQQACPKCDDITSHMCVGLTTDGVLLAESGLSAAIYYS